MAYQLEGRLLEVCTCNVLCPCWVGEDADGGTCESALAWRIDKGSVNGTDVSGLTIGWMAHIPGNILKGNWSIILFVDDNATAQQQESLVNVWTGKLGGPIADLAKLVSRVISVQRTRIIFDVQGGKGTLKIGPKIEAEMAPFQGATGKSTALHDTVFSTIPGSPAFVGKASKFMVQLPEHGFEVNIQGHNAIQGNFHVVN